MIPKMLQTRFREIHKAVGDLAANEAFEIYLQINGMEGRQEEIGWEKEPLEGKLFCFNATADFSDDMAELKAALGQKSLRHEPNNILVNSRGAWWDVRIPEELSLKFLVLGDLPPAFPESLLQAVELNNRTYWNQFLKKTDAEGQENTPRSKNHEDWRRSQSVCEDRHDAQA
jgi:hypothetical protein